MRGNGAGQAKLLSGGHMHIPITQSETVRLFAHLIERVHCLERQLRVVRPAQSKQGGRNQPRLSGGSTRKRKDLT